MRKTTEERLIGQLLPKLSELLGQKIEPSDLRLHPAKGYWTHTHQDVMGWQGWIKISGQLVRSIGSWNNMSDCVRYGFMIHDERGEYRAERDFMVEALNVRRPRI
jgi:hypothetical protein